jgi:hypothetical protein
MIEHSSLFLPDLFSNLLLFEFKQFGAVNGDLPLIVYSELQRINMNEYLVLNDEEKKEALIETKTSAFELPLIIGSAESIKLQRILNDCTNKGIFKSELIQFYIREKWNKMFIYLVLYTLLLWSNIGLIVGIITTDFNIYLMLSIVFINIILFIFELIQLAYCGFVEYFTSAWNIIDQLRLILTFTWIILLYFESSIVILTWLMIIINAIKGLIGFRTFDKTRFYVRLIIRAFQDVFFFMIIFFYSTLAFGLLFASTKDIEPGNKLH